MRGADTPLLYTKISVRYIIEGSNTVEEYSSPTDVSPLLQSMKLILQTRRDSAPAAHSECYDLSVCWNPLRTLPWVHADGLTMSGRTRDGKKRVCGGAQLSSRNVLRRHRASLF